MQNDRNQSDQAESGQCTEAFADGSKRHPHNPGGHDKHAHADMPTDLPKVSTGMVLLVGLVVVAAFAGLFFVGFMSRHHRQEEVDKDMTSNDLKPIVEVATPRKMEAPPIVLPADIRAYQETSLFPRANGYLRKLHVDIGDKVKGGQLLAEIEAPDTEADLVAAKAAVAQADATLVKGQNDLELAKATLDRYEGFSSTGGVTRQQLDERRAAFTQAQSTLAADKANVEAAKAQVVRMEALVGFEKIYSPFDGVVTARNFDVGALMTSGTGTAILRIADTHILRVFVNVPQFHVQSIHNGDVVGVAVRNYPDRVFDGTVTRSTDSLDPATRTLRYEVDVKNTEGLLYAGMYGEVRITAKDSETPLVVPTSAVVFDAEGTKVWVIDEQKKVHVKKVDPGSDFGTEMQIAKGLDGTEQIVTNPGARLAEGVEVDAHLPAAKQPAQAAAR